MYHFSKAFNPSCFKAKEEAPCTLELGTVWIPRTIWKVWKREEFLAQSVMELIFICCQVRSLITLVDCVWNVIAHEQKPYFVFQRNGRVHLNWKGSQFSRLLAAEVCASAVVMLDTQSSEVVSMVLATHSIRQFPLHFYSRASPCAITFQLDSAYTDWSMTTPYRLWAAIKLCRWPPMTQRSQWIL